MPVLYVVGCGAPPVLDIASLIESAIDRGWDTWLTLTPTADRWLTEEQHSLADRTGHPVRSTYKLPGEPDVHPPADAMLVAPVTSNTLNKWANGISDTLALGLIVEALGLDLPVVAMPWVNPPLYRHPAFADSVAVLRAVGVRITGDQPRVPGERADWHTALDTLSLGPR